MHVSCTTWERALESLIGLLKSRQIWDVQIDWVLKQGIHTLYIPVGQSPVLLTPISEKVFSNYNLETLKTKLFASQGIH